MRCYRVEVSRTRAQYYVVSVGERTLVGVCARGRGELMPTRNKRYFGSGVIFDLKSFPAMLEEETLA